MKKENAKIAIVGGGLSGLVLAEGLQERGYQKVTLFEQDTRLGGKINSINYRGKSYELGAIFGLPTYGYLKKFMNQYNIKADGPKLSRTNYNACGEKIRPIPGDDIQNFVEELRRLPLILEEYKSLKEFHLGSIEPMLMEPFSKWCDHHKLSVLKTVYTHYFTIFGLGSVDEVPAVYVLRIISFEHLMSFMDIPQFTTWQQGASTLIQVFEKKIKDLRLGQKVTDICRAPQGNLLIKTSYEQETFDKVILAAPLEQFTHLSFWDEETKFFLKQIKYQKFNVYAFLIDGELKGCGSILDNLSEDRRGHILLWDARWSTKEPGEQLVILYAYSPPENALLTPLQYIKDDLAQLGIPKARLYQARRWQHCPYVDSTILNQGFYKKMESLQGKHNLYLSGEIMNMLSIENAIKNSKHLLERFF